MLYLITVSIIWSFSFSLIKGTLTSIDPIFVAFMRLFISLIIFLPFLKIRNLNLKLSLHLIIIGVLQYGLMYVAYIYSYQFLKAYEIAILTILTPIFVVIIFDFWTRKYIFLHWVKAILAIVGAGIIVFSGDTTLGFWKGIILIQFSNILFAFGQVYYKKIMVKEDITNQKSHFALVFLGATLITSVLSISTTDFGILEMNSDQWLTLLYLGVIASGICFFLWNVGVTKVEAGTVAVMNNLKIPLGVVFAFILLGESVNFIQLVLGSLFILLAITINDKYYGILHKPK